VISDQLERACKNLASRGNARTYMVIDASPKALLVLVVPRGAENLPVSNSLGSKCSFPADDTAGDWIRLDAPTLVTVLADRLPADPRPTPLRDVSKPVTDLKES
jgi:hypothetical protein